ncbi:MAG: CheY-like chemotaxis protein [bacterium]|jgi:CheY-like chemotaxis protein
MKNNFRILVVDDDPVMRSLLSFRLESAGYIIETCESGEEVLELIEKINFLIN